MTERSDAMPDKKSLLSWKALLSGSLIGTLGGLIGLGGAEFRLPVLIGLFRLGTLEAIVINKATSLIVVGLALLFRLPTIPLAQVLAHSDIILQLLLGSLAGAWFAAGHALTMSRQQLDRFVAILLIGLACLLISEAFFTQQAQPTPLIEAGALRFAAGVLAGFGIGVVAAFLGVAGGELLIPTIVLLYGQDVKLAGSLSLAVSLPTMLVGFFRYRQSTAFSVLQREKPLFVSLALGSAIGVFIGGLLLGAISTQALIGGLGIILLVSSVKMFLHGHRQPATRTPSP
jgi:uncharacterized protein